MDTLATTLKEETAALKAEEKELRQRLREGAQVVPLPDLKATIAALGKEKADLAARLNKLKSGDVKPVSQAEKKKVHEQWSKIKKSCEARKKIRARVWKDLVANAENRQEKRMDAEAVEELKEELGLEF